MKYTAPAVLAPLDATALIQGGKSGAFDDNGNLMERSTSPAYGSDE